MTVRVSGGIISDQMLSGSLRFFKISSGVSGAFANTVGAGFLAADPNNAGSGYAIGEVITITGGTFSTAATFRVNSQAVISGDTEVDYSSRFTGGEDYAAGDIITLSDGSVVTVGSVSAGEVTGFTITSGSERPVFGPGTIQQAEVYPIGGTGFSITTALSNLEVRTLELIDAGEYTSYPTSPAGTTTSGSGTSLTVDLRTPVIVPGAPTTGGNPLATYQFYVPDGQPVPNSAADRILSKLAQRCTIVQISLVDDNNIHLVAENKGFAWPNDNVMEEVIQDLGTIGGGAVDGPNPPVPDSSTTGTTVDLSGVTLTEVTTFRLA